ncbi:hypothetical protein HK096_009309, partial [Nowakowskiella sp. JEL0078]
MKRETQISVVDAEKVIKRRKKKYSRNRAHDSLSFKKHPLGIKPWGNFLFADNSSGVNIRESGLGFFRIWDDSFVASFLSDTSVLTASDIAILSNVSKAFYCFCSVDFLWRILTIREFAGNFSYSGSWRETYRLNFAKKRSLSLQSPSASLVVDDFYSDYLFSTWKCTSVSLEDMCGSNEQLMRDNIDRRNNLSLSEFRKEYAEINKP